MTDRITITFDTLPSGGEGLELDGITPDRLLTLSNAEIAKLPVWMGRRSVPLGDIAAIQGELSAHLRFEGDLARAEGVGAGMASGVLDVTGSVGDGAGVAMRGGSLRIGGSAGMRLGAALPGASRGMLGGEIVVTGSVGAEAGAYARRGLIVVRGDVGDSAARGLIAGTLVVFGRVGADAGTGNKRGSIVVLGSTAVPPTYRFACVYRPTVLRVLFGYLRRAYSIPVADRFVAGRWKRYCGDISELGKGELLTWAEA
jgi:formylmethanofuran dehydrogenase subunit C